MPTVYCPSCNRALHLPEALQGVTACCPLCRTNFPTPSEPPPPQILPRLAADPVPSKPWGAKEQHVPPVPRRIDRDDETFEFDDSLAGDELSLNHREALRSAARWLRWFVGVSCVQLFTCGCGNGFMLVGQFTPRHDFGEGVVCFLIPFVLEIFSLVMIFKSAESTARSRKRGLAVAGCVLTLVLAGLHLLLPLLALLVGRRQDETFFLVSMGMAFVVAVVGLIGAVRGLMILNEAEVVRYFQSRR